MSTSAAVSGALAAAAAASASAARDAECRTVLAGYEPKGASVEMQREYASCVYRIHGSGEPLDPMAAFLIKVAVVLAFLGAAAGIFFSRQDPWNSWGDAALYAVGGAILFPSGLGLILLAGAGIQFLFS